ncbi:hypothetical protein CQ11_03230 [Trueperella pyogenes]|uniref:hypothetical protein n=1 Tax=Trueperella pyogenes TaxID=1661 RepID=UPI00043ACB23|nr:hypothetical protein [Trueperella pyogenes]AHU90441.1 hypothetical protein CQ11_03230 [Trueperella pyogenes]AWA43102.1 hypothetical protein DBV13_03215 [Trueperella pyogenes]
MSIEQVAFAIPARIEAGLATGKLVRYGGVVRDDAGHIVMHLKEVPTPQFDKALASVRAFAKANKTTLIVGTVATAAIGGTAIAVSTMKRMKINKADRQFQAAMSAYFKAIVAQDMNAKVIDELDRSLGELRALTGKSTTDLIEGDVLDSLIDYSRNFIVHNAPAEFEQVELGQLVSLEDYLAEQKKIFDQAS